MEIGTNNFLNGWVYNDEVNTVCLRTGAQILNEEYWMGKSLSSKNSFVINRDCKVWKLRPLPNLHGRVHDTNEFRCLFVCLLFCIFSFPSNLDSCIHST